MSWREALAGQERRLSGKRMTVGFDGFADRIVRPLCPSDTPGEAAQPFPTIRAFGEYLIGKAEKSCSIELREQARQLGGNMPFLSRTAGGLGAAVQCIGMLGANGTVDPLFADMPCTLHSFAAPGESTCMEFDDGKILLSSDCTLPEDAWTLIERATGNRAQELLIESDLLALVNWSELSFAHDLWEHALTSLRAVPADKNRYVFFDLCDIARRSAAECDAVLRLIGRFSAYRTTVLSLNENEALLAGERLLNGEQALPEIAHRLRTQYAVDEVIVHTIRQTLLVTPRGMTVQDTRFVEHPRISTGAGDNFNGASCAALLLGLCDADRVEFANDFAHYYVKNGVNPSFAQLMIKK